MKQLNLCGHKMLFPFQISQGFIFKRVFEELSYFEELDSYRNTKTNEDLEFWPEFWQGYVTKKTFQMDQKYATSY